MAKVELDQSKCIGCGTCVALCPENFEMDGAKAKAKGDASDCAQQAVDNCPVNCIAVK